MEEKRRQESIGLDVYPEDLESRKEAGREAGVSPFVASDQSIIYRVCTPSPQPGLRDFGRYHNGPIIYNVV